MAFYNVNGQQINSAYLSNGNDALIAYSQDGDTVYEKTGVEDYYETQSGLRRQISLSLLGSLKYAQSFCKYNGKFYSTDGSNIAEQGEDFALLRDVALSVGHGNGFQLGSNGLAYISGWDDQTVYIVDLTTLTLSGTITLPTEGYTTCVVDDTAGLAYIFQRPTRPNTERVYNFIVYDYVNDETLYTAITEVAFGAMQAADWCGDNILVLNGYGTAELPNGYRLYDKQGNIVGEYVIGSESTVEPEGVACDNATNEILISYANKKVYEVMQ